MPITLIQLISEETMQNLLPVLALRPARLVHLVTAKVSERSAPIAAAARASEIHADPETVPLSEMPSSRETFAAVRDAIREVKASGGLPVVNFTGGTKLMSIGAFSAALQEKIPSLYVDTEHGHFIDGMTGDGIGGLLGGDLTFQALGSALSVDSVALANGCPHVTKGKDWSKYIGLAEYFLTHREQERQCHEVLYGPNGLFPNGREPKKKKDWEAAANKPLALPQRAGDLGVSAGLLCGDDQGRFMLPNTGDVELWRFAVSFFTGAWWEVAVMRAANDASIFSDLRWSANFGAQSGSGKLEEDIVGLDGVQIAYISCKRSASGNRPLPLLEEIESRARRIGGKYARKFLAIYLPIEPSLKERVGQRADELQIRVLCGDEISRPASFARANKDSAAVEQLQSLTSARTAARV